MATILDVGLLQYFVPAFVFFFVLVVVWALLEKTNFFGGNKFANLMIAFCLAVLFIVIPELTTIIALTTPWFVILFIFLLLIILVFLFMGVEASAIAKVFGGDNPAVTWTILIVAFAIFGYAFTQVYGEQIHAITAGEAVEGEETLTQSIGAILFTPKILGMLFLMVIAALAVRFVSAPITGK